MGSNIPNNLTPSRGYEQEPEYERVISEENFAIYLKMIETDGCPKAEEFFESVKDQAAWERNLIKAGKK